MSPLQRTRGRWIQAASLASVGALALAAGVSLCGGDGAEPAAGPAARPVAAIGAGAVAEARGPAAFPGRQAVAEPSAEPDTGRVLDLDGHPIGGVRIVASGERARCVALSDELGRFDWPAQGACDALTVDDPAWVTLVAVRPCERRSRASTPIVVAPAIELAGRVVGGGRGLGGARVALRLDLKALQSSFDPAAWVAPTSFALDADAGGWFRIRAAPAARGLRLSASHADFAPALIEIAPVARHDLQVELAPKLARFGTLRGLVEHADGRPAPDVMVSAGANGVRTDARGSFELALERDPGGQELRARAAGFADARASFAVAPGELAFVTVRLGPQLQALSGQVEDGDGRAAKGCSVEVFADAACSERVAHARCDEAGRFEAPALAPGEYWVVARQAARSVVVAGPCPSGRPADELRLRF